jgi:hypothetical protein
MSTGIEAVPEPNEAAPTRIHGRVQAEENVVGLRREREADAEAPSSSWSTSRRGHSRRSRNGSAAIWIDDHTLVEV